MDRTIIEHKLESLRRCLRRIEQKCPPDATMLAHDPDLQDIIALNLTRAIQLCVDMGAHIIAGMESKPPDTMGETFEILAGGGAIPQGLALQMRKAVGFRNIAVHNYEEINWAIVHAIAQRNLRDFEEFARFIDRSSLA